MYEMTTKNAVYNEVRKIGEMVFAQMWEDLYYSIKGYLDAYEGTNEQFQREFVPYLMEVKDHITQEWVEDDFHNLIEEILTDTIQAEEEYDDV